MEHFLINSIFQFLAHNFVIRFLVYTPLGLIILFSVGLFDILFFSLLLMRRTTKYLVEDLGLARHVLVTWLIVPSFWGFILLLKKTGKMIVILNGIIPWEEVRLAFAGNHKMPKLQDTFLMPPIISSLKPVRIRNPIRYFPFTMADTANFFNSSLFTWLLGPLYLVSVNRGAGPITKARNVLDVCEKRWREYSGSLITNIEGGRTQSATRWITSEKGSRLGEPTRGIAMLALKTNTPVIPYWGRIIEVSYRRISFKGLVLKPIWRLIEWICRNRWQKLGFYGPRPKACPETVLWGLLELGLNPGIEIHIDINHPAGPIRPIIGEEDSRQLTNRIVQALLDLGDYQLERIERSRKK